MKALFEFSGAYLHTYDECCLWYSKGLRVRQAFCYLLWLCFWVKKGVKSSC